MSWLLAAKVGVDLLDAYGQSLVQKGALGLQRAESKLTQFQVERQGRLLAEQRVRQFASALGTQNAEVANAGIVGGRTARLLTTEAQMAFSRQQQEDAMAVRFGVSQEQGRQSVLRAQSRAARAGLALNLLGIGVDAKIKWGEIDEAKRAETPSRY